LYLSRRDRDVKVQVLLIAITGLDVIFHVHCFYDVNMMSSSNYSIGLQRLKHVHTAYCGLHNSTENWSWARDETETLTIFLETKPRRDVSTSRDRDVETENTTLQGRVGFVGHKIVCRVCRSQGHLLVLICCWLAGCCCCCCCCCCCSSVKSEVTHNSVSEE